VSAPFELLDEERPGKPTPGADSLGVERTHQPHRHAVPQEGEAGERLEYSLIEGACRSGEVMGYLDALAEEAENAAEEVVVVLDNASFHTAKVVSERREGWEAKGLRLYFLPAYSPHLNLIEGVWRRLKGFLMPRRFYDSVSELKRAVLHALRLLGAVEIHCQLGDT
jgi:putative transposase